MSIANAHGEVVFIEYRGGRPFAARVRTSEGCTEFEFDWCKRDGLAYYRELGDGGDPNVAKLSRYNADPSEFWAADDVRLVDDYGNTVLDASETDGWVRLAKPQGDPFEGAAESDTEGCGVCNDRLPSEQLCGHLFENERDGGIAGAGRGVPDADDLDDIERAVRATGCARKLRESLRTKHYAAAWFLRKRFDDDTPEGVGAAWLGTLDKQTTEANAAVLARLEAVVAEQDARRASGERCYRVKVDRHSPVFLFLSERKSWAEAWDELRTSRILFGPVGRETWIVRMVPKRRRR